MRCLCGRRSRSVRLIALISFIPVIFAIQGSALAGLISPLTVSNYNPLVAIYGLPHIGDAELLERDAVRTDLAYETSSHYAAELKNNEYIMLDGETVRSTFNYRQGILDHVEMGLVVPYVKHHGGGLDSFINNWHNTFGMPQGGRDKVDNNQFRYTYVRDFKTRFDLRTPSGGLGDVQVQLAWQLQKNTSHASALEVSVKLPTGDSDKLLGSGAVDAAMWYKAETQRDYYGYRGGSFYSLGIIYLGKGDVLPDMARRSAGFGGLGAGVYLTDKLLFISQLDINTSFYTSSDLVELDSYAAQLTLGGSVILSQQGRMNFGVGEDLIIDASPDVTFHVDVGWRF